jgi:hypothetical protein
MWAAPAVNSNESSRTVVQPRVQPGRFCTGCGTFNLSAHRFCDHCGLPLPQPKVDQPPGEVEIGKRHAVAYRQTVQQATEPSANSKHLRWLAPGATLCCLLVAALAAIIWRAAAPPPTHEEVLAALRASGAHITKPGPDLLCLQNLPYHRHHIQILPTDTATRDWLDGLVLAGLYAPGVEVVTDGLTVSTLLQYQTLPALNQWRREGKLCIAQGWDMDSIRVSAVEKTPETQHKRYVASLSWTAHTVAPWLAHLPPVGLRLAGVNVDSEGPTSTTQQILERVNGRWSIVER